VKPELLTAKQVAEALNVTPQQVAAWKRKGLPANGRKYDPAAVEKWLIENDVAADPEAPPDPFAHLNEQIERTTDDAAAALGVDRRTVFTWLKDPSFPGFAGTAGQRNGMFPVERIKAWRKAKTEKQPAGQAAGRAADPYRTELDRIKVEMQRQRLAEMAGETLPLATAVALMAQSHAGVKQLVFELLDDFKSAFPRDMDDLLKKTALDRMQVKAENACLAAAEFIEELTP